MPLSSSRRIQMQPTCSKCNEEAVYLRRYTAEALCKGCLVKTTVDRVRRTINKHKMLNETDRIAVAISGGKDSAVLLDVLVRIEQAYPKAELVPFTIDEGIVGYRDKALEAARVLVSEHHLPLTVRSFHDIFGHTLDSIVAERMNSSMGACSYCGVLRRRAINVIAKELNADVVATGHILDDEAQTVMMNMLRGDSRRIARTNRSRLTPKSGFVPRVKPIMELSERDVVAYAYHLQLPYHDVPCPYADEAYRSDLRIFLNEMENKRPGTLLAILRSAEAIVDALEKSIGSSTFQYCEVCGAPTSMRRCKVCSILDELEG
jgi:uncharacterized protein (TIGR00269 family)